MPKKIVEYSLFPLFRRFINEIKRGKRIQKSGKRISPNSIKNYERLEALLVNFSSQKPFPIRLKILTSLSKKHFEIEKKYWKIFYLQFSSYLYEDLNCFDNYVGRLFKLLRCFFNYLIAEKGMNIGAFHRNFYTPSEEVEIVVLTPERLNNLIYSTELKGLLPADLVQINDVFIFGCTVALRFSDLMALTKLNLEVINERMYVKMQSKKTQTYTRVKLPAYAIEIVKKYLSLSSNKLLPQYNKATFNLKVKKLMELAGYNEFITRTRQRRGKPIVIFKDPKTKRPYKFSDSVTSHTMRRSAITTMLSLGMNEHMVRQISGHAANSKDFFRYVSFSQSYIDTEIDKVHQKFETKKLVLN